MGGGGATVGLSGDRAGLLGITTVGLDHNKLVTRVSRARPDSWDLGQKMREFLVNVEELEDLCFSMTTNDETPFTIEIN